MTDGAQAYRGEVDLHFGDRTLILRCSWGALAQLWPLLMAAPPETVELRRKWYAISHEGIGKDVPPAEMMEWHHQLLGAVAANEVDTVARAIAIFAHEHHPEITADEVKRVSPGWGMVWRATCQLIQLFHWRPGEAQEVAKSAHIPFTLVKRLVELWESLLRTGSARPNSGA